MTAPAALTTARGKRSSLSAALKLTASLEPSTTAEILDRVAAGLTSDTDLNRMAYLRRTGEPGTRLWKMPTYTDDGYHGLGEAATSLGLAVIGIEALFGTPATCWTVRYRTDSGEESTVGGWALLTLEEARERWWILSGDRRNLVSGGHPHRQKVANQLHEYPNCLIFKGSEFIAADGRVVCPPPMTLAAGGSLPRAESSLEARS